MHGRQSANVGSRVSVLCALTLALGCSGTVGSPGESSSGGPSGGAGSGSATTGGTTTGGSGTGQTTTGGQQGTGGQGTSASDQLTAPTLRRLTISQYENSVRDLLGSTVKLPDGLEADAVLSGFASLGAAKVSLSAQATEQFDSAALDLAHQALSDTTNRAKLVGCAPAGTTDEACARTFVTKFGRKAWRRPLTADEVTRYVAVAKQASTALADFHKGLEYALAGILESPYFLYRQELGTPDSQNKARRNLTGFEVATRLSYLMWNTTPDDALLDAAAAGELDSAEGLQKSAQRLLDATKTRTAMQNFFSELLRLAELDQLPQTTAAYKQMSATMGASMRTETLRVLDDIAFGSQVDYRTLFSTTSTFLNPELAKLYGVTSQGTDFSAVTLPKDGPRAGLLGQGSFLALNAHSDSTSPTRRGKFIREVLMCEPVPPPPDDVDTTIPDTPAGTTPLTMREKMTKHRTVATCASCHGFMDPIGLGLEAFDGIGAYRTTEAGKKVDASGTLDKVDFADARGLGVALQNSAEVPTCLTRDVFRYATGHLESDGEEGFINDMAARFGSGGYKFKGLLLAVTDSGGFRYTGPLD